MAEKREQGSAKPRTPRQPKQQPAQPKEQEQQQQQQSQQKPEQTLRVLIVRNCIHGGQEYKVLRRYELPRKAALQLIAGGNAKPVR